MILSCIATINIILTALSLNFEEVWIINILIKKYNVIYIFLLMKIIKTIEYFGEDNKFDSHIRI